MLLHDFEHKVAFWGLPMKNRQNWIGRCKPVHGRSLEVRKGLRGQDLNLLPSGYEPAGNLTIFSAFPPIFPVISISVSLLSLDSCAANRMRIFFRLLSFRALQKSTNTDSAAWLLHGFFQLLLWTHPVSRVCPTLRE